MQRVFFRTSSAMLLLGVLGLPACAQQDSPEAVIADCGGHVPREKVDSCLERARVIDETNPSAQLQALEAQLEQRARRHENAQNGPPPGYNGSDQGPPPPGYGNQSPPPGYDDNQQPPPGYGDNQPPPPGYDDNQPPPPDTRTTDQAPPPEGPAGDLSPPVDQTGSGDVMPPDDGAQGPPPDNTPPPDDAETQGPN